MGRFLFLLFFSFVVLYSATGHSDEQKIIKSHALTLTGDIMYGPDFTHYEYANPNAPKGGTYHTIMIKGSDNFNPYSLKDLSEMGPMPLNAYIYDSLMSASGDEAATYYGLIAESIEYPADCTWIIFNLRKTARWHDGTPITAKDVIFTYTAATAANPVTKDKYRFVTKVEAMGDYRVKFYIKPFDVGVKHLETLAQMIIIPEHFWKDKDLTKSYFEPVLTSGPYKVAYVDPGKKVIMERVPDYWAQDLPVRKGLYNYDKLIYDYYRDQTVALEAFKGGHIDSMHINSSREYYKGVTGKYVDMGLIKRREVPNMQAQGMYGITFNTTVKPLDDVRVREALVWVYDFEWINKNNYFNAETRNNSYFANSDLACDPVPSPQVQAIIKSVKPDVSEDLLTKPFKLPTTDGSGENRENLIHAVKLLESAGYKIVKGKMTGPDGKPVKLEITIQNKTFENELLNFKRGLEQIGIDFFIRYVDTTQYTQLKRNKDYMMVYEMVKHPLYPGREQIARFGSVGADTPGSPNYARIKDPAIDKLIEYIIDAPDRKSAIPYVQAMDRLLMAGWYAVPGGYTGRFRAAYWDKFGMPDRLPKSGLGYDVWWIDPVKEANLDKILGR